MRFVCRITIVGWTLVALMASACNIEESYRLSSESNAVHRANVNENGQSLDVIIQTTESVDQLAAFILTLGDTVKFRYKNVAALAAEISPANLTPIAEFPGVFSVEKDEILTMDQDIGEKPKMFKAMEVLPEAIKPVDMSTVDMSELPQGYANFQLSGAAQVWDATGYGQGSIVAVVDTGTTPNDCIAHAVIGAPGFPEGYNATHDPKSAIDPGNHYHGTFVGGVVASSCILDLSFDPEHPLSKAITTHTSWSPDFIPVIGQAPGAKLYPVKVFETVSDPITGEILGTVTETSVILDGLDHLITLKKEGLLDIDIVNLSLGGPTLYDGRDALDKFIKKLLEEGIFVVSATGNEGPIPNTVASPATSYYSLKVGALDYAVSSRVLYEYLGLTKGIEGQGMVMRPTDETRVANFSSRGPLSDGRSGPDLSALGMWNFQADPTGALMWSSGTSFACPTVAGAAALLNAYMENVQHQETNPLKLMNVLKAYADPSAVGESWSDRNTVGVGALDVVASFAAMSDDTSPPLIPNSDSGELKPNILFDCHGCIDCNDCASCNECVDCKDCVDCNDCVDCTECSDCSQCTDCHYCDHCDECTDCTNCIDFHNQENHDETATYESDLISLSASESIDFVFEIQKETNMVVAEIIEIDTPDNSTTAYWPNGLEITLESAKRSAQTHPVHLLWYSFAYGETAIYKIYDGNWIVNGQPFLNQPMEPGLMKLSLSGDFSNESPVHCKVRITRQNKKEKLHGPIYSGKIKEGDQFFMPIKIPSGVKQATFDLTWKNDWSHYPTSDIDMYIFDPNYLVVSYDGATLNAPERVVVDSPIEGTWYVLINGYEMYKKDKYELFLSLDME